MTTVSSMGVIHFPKRMDAVMGRVGQKNTRLRIPVTGLGNMCFWFMAYNNRTVTPTTDLYERGGSDAADAMVAVAFRQRDQRYGSLSLSSLLLLLLLLLLEDLLFFFFWSVLVHRPCRVFFSALDGFWFFLPTNNNADNPKVCCVMMMMMMMSDGSIFGVSTFVPRSTPNRSHNHTVQSSQPYHHHNNILSGMT